MDVNVHPNKTIVKFLYTSLVYSLITEAFKKFQKSFLAKLINNVDFVESDNLKSMQSIQEEKHNNIEDVFENKINENRNRIENQDQTNTGKIKNDTYKMIECDIKSNLIYYAGITTIFLIEIRKKKELTIDSDTEFSMSSLRILDLQKLTLYYLILHLKEIDYFDESKITPLLVSIPFSIADKKLDDYFNVYSSFGFDFDRLSETTVVLRSIPQFLNEVDYTKILDLLIFSLKDFFDKKINLISHAKQNFDRIDLGILKERLEEYFFIDMKKDSYKKSVYFPDKIKLSGKYMEKMDKGSERCILQVIDAVGVEEMIKQKIEISLEEIIRNIGF